MPRRRFGSVRKLPSGRWQARYIDRAGRRHTAPETFVRKTDADRHLSLLEAELERGTWIDPTLGRVTFDTWCDRYLAGAIHKARTTLSRDEAVLRAHWRPALGKLPLASITPLDIRGVIEELTTNPPTLQKQPSVDARGAPAEKKTRSPRTIDTSYAVVRAVFAAAVEAGLIQTSPCRGIPLPKKSRARRTFLTIDDLKKLADAMPDKHEALVWVTTLLGLRFSEMAGLRVKDLDFLARPPTVTIEQRVTTVNGRIDIDQPKTERSRRTLTVPQLVMDLLSRHLATTGRTHPDEYVFQAPRGGPLNYNHFRTRVWDPARKAAGFPTLPFHGLRHTSAGLMRSAGVHTQVIADRLGHSSDRVTSAVYGWAPDELDQEAGKRLNDLLGDSFGHGGGTDASETEAG